MSTRSFYYILVGRVAVPATMEEWVAWSMENTRETGQVTQVVRRDQIGDILVSTVFLGLDHGMGAQMPQVFETMIFGGEHNDYQRRYATWGAALRGHQRALRLVRGEQQDE